MKLNIYMKSGNVIHIHGVKSWDANKTGDRVSFLKITYTWFALHVYCKERLLVKSINLSQIEAITIG